MRLHSCSEWGRALHGAGSLARRAGAIWPLAYKGMGPLTGLRISYSNTPVLDTLLGKRPILALNIGMGTKGKQIYIGWGLIY